MFFESINKVPPRLRKLRGTALSHDQIEVILARTDEISTGANDFPNALAQARTEFMEAHEQVAGAWAAKGAK